MADDYILYEISDILKSRVFDERSKTPLTTPPACMCAGTTYYGNEMTIDIYIADEQGNILQIGKEDCVQLVYIFILFNIYLFFYIF